MIRERSRLATSRERTTGLACIEAGIKAADPRRIVESAVRVSDDRLEVGSESLPLAEVDRILVVGAGKASGPVAAALESVLGNRIAAGVVVAPEPWETERIDVVVGDHPVPSKASMRGAERVLELVQSADASTVILVVISGGGSALLPLPASGVSFQSLQSVTDALVKSGASIHEINTVRKHLSAVKGGQLARAASPARVMGLVFSDVVGDDMSVIASGPTAPDKSTFAAAQQVLDTYEVAVPTDVRSYLESGVNGAVPETPVASDSVFDRVSNQILASAWTAIEGARAEAHSRGYDVCVLSSRVRGEAREVAKVHVGIAEECRTSGNPIEPPAVVLSGGETTVTVRGEGHGGPNLEFALSAAIELGLDGVCVVSVDTDGRDGGTDAAGGIVDAGTVTDLDDARHALLRNDSYAYLSDQNGIILTGATGTNVNDLRAIVIEETE